VAGSGRHGVPAPRQAPAGAEDGEPGPEAGAGCLPAAGPRGPEHLPVTVSQRGKASRITCRDRCLEHARQTDTDLALLKQDCVHRAVLGKSKHWNGK